jgi:hypothetical protein
MAAVRERKRTGMVEQETSICTDVPRAEVIARLNDTLRKKGEGGTIMITQGVKLLTGFDAIALAAGLADYAGFDSDNDPHGERDFGDLTLFGADLLWKIDYYDLAQQYHSDNPADASITSRVLTVMLASEW